MRHLERTHHPRRRSERSDLPDSRHFEVQKRDETGLIASVIFSTERQALAFADALAHLMAKTGEQGSVQVVWPRPHALGG
ncbi:MAG TPA: hypothetical protein VGK50_01485 [Coriobacteriia bacterium]|jgi:hypothetical protein